MPTSLTVRTSATYVGSTNSYSKRTFRLLTLYGDVSSTTRPRFFVEILKGDGNSCFSEAMVHQIACASCRRHLQLGFNTFNPYKSNPFPSLPPSRVFLTGVKGRPNSHR